MEYVFKAGTDILQLRLNPHFLFVQNLWVRYRSFRRHLSSPGHGHTSTYLHGLLEFREYVLAFKAIRLHLFPQFFLYVFSQIVVHPQSCHHFR